MVDEGSQSYCVLGLAFKIAPFGAPKVNASPYLAKNRHLLLLAIMVPGDLGLHGVNSTAPTLWLSGFPTRLETEAD